MPDFLSFGSKGSAAQRQLDAAPRAGAARADSAAAQTQAAARRRRAFGFTIIELMITLAVAAILAMIAAPSFKHVLVSTNLSNINNDLVGDLQYARTEAVSRQVSIAVAASTGGWQQGWKVQVVPASSTATATVLRQHPAIPARYSLDGGAVTDVTYRAQGTPASTAGACFTISASNGEHNSARFLQVLPAGMVQQTTGTTPPSSACPAPKT